MRRMLLCLTALSALALLSGCSSAIVVTASELCRDWRHQSVSKDDKLTDKTASGIEGSNEARVNWGCKPGENISKS
jgi:uncharacterized protein YceK